MGMALWSSVWVALESDQHRRMPVWSGVEGPAFEEELDHPHVESQPMADSQQAL